MKESRTHKSIKNSTIALLFYTITFILNFYSRKIFLEYLGVEILGLNTTAQTLLQFLNLSELGINTAVGFTLYKPLAEGDSESINEIISLQSHLYKRIATSIIICAVILMSFFPEIFAKMELPLWYAYASFSVLLFSSLLGYFVNYKQIILTSSQQDYKVQFSFKSVQLVKICVQMLTISLSENGYVWWLILEFTFAIIASVSLHRMTIKTFPELKKSILSFKDLRKKYTDFTRRLRQMFVHKLGGFALTQSSPLIIYAYTSLSMVALYGNYVIILNGVQQLIAAVFNSLTAGVGNLVAEGNRTQIWSVFCELFSIRFFLASTLCFVLYNSTDLFISAWIGTNYILPKSTLIILIAILFVKLTRDTEETFINAYGIYQDIYAPIAETILNLGLSVLLGYYYGINGVLLGVLTSLVVVVILWKPYFLCTRGIKNKYKSYILIYFKHIILAVAAWIIALGISRLIVFDFNKWMQFFFVSTISTIIFGGTLFLLLYITGCGIKSSIHRLRLIVKK